MASNLNSASDHSNIIENSDSESDTKSDIAFLAVPEQFRPSSITTKSPLLKPGSVSTRIENKISNNPSESKPLSYSKQPDEIPLQKDSATGNLEKASTKYEERSFRDKSLPPETDLLPLLQKEKYSKETGRTRNELSDEDSDEPIRCQNTKRTSNAYGITKQRMPNQDIHENRRKSRNTTGSPRESKNTTISETCEKKINETIDKDEPISLSKSATSIIELDVANLPPMNKMKQYSKNKVKYEIMPGKEENYTTLPKRNPINKKYRKRNQPKQVSFSIKKQENIRWDSDLNLNRLHQNFYSSTSQEIDKRWLKLANHTIEWTIVRQEKTFISARKSEGNDMNNYHQSENMKADYSSKSLFKAEEKSSDDETNTHIAVRGIEKNEPKTSNRQREPYDGRSKVYNNNLKEKNNNRLTSIHVGNKNFAISGIGENEPKTITKTSNQHVSNKGELKECNTQTIVHRNNQKRKNNILMSIRASCGSDCKKSESFEKSQEKVQYDCCKEYSTTYDEYESSEEGHCCACEISKSSNEMDRSDRELSRDQIINKNFREKNLHQRRLLNNKQDSVLQIGQTELKNTWNCETNNYEKPENLRKSCCEDEREYYGQHVTSEEDELSTASFCDTKELLGSSKKAGLSSQKRNFNQSRNVGSRQRNLCQQTTDSNNKDSCFLKKESKDGKLDHCKVAEENKIAILDFGKEISDLIIGCHTALSAFFSIYNEWSILRRNLIQQFEQLAENIKESSNKYEKYNDILRVVNIGAAAAGAIPHPAVAMAAKIVSAISGLLTTLIKTSKPDKANVEEPSITMSLFDDIGLSSLLYMYGVQCNQQFEETIKFIEKSLPNISFGGFSASEDADMAIFLQGVSEYTPKHRIFYKKLHTCFQELIRKCNSPFSRRFCEPFLLYESDSINVIEYLDWQFAPDYNNESVKYELEGINRLIEDKSTSMKDLLSRIRNCIKILKDEMSYVERSITKVSMFNTSFGTFKTN